MTATAKKISNIENNIIYIIIIKYLNEFLNNYNNINFK